MARTFTHELAASFCEREPSCRISGRERKEAAGKWQQTESCGAGTARDVRTWSTFAAGTFVALFPSMDPPRAAPTSALPTTCARYSEFKTKSAAESRDGSAVLAALDHSSSTVR